VNMLHEAYAARMDGHFLPFSSASFSLHFQQTVRQNGLKSVQHYTPI
jgi:hypothetical protein